MPPGPKASVRPLALARRALWSLIGFCCGVAASATVMVILAQATESSSHGWLESARMFGFATGFFAAPVWVFAMLPISLFATSDASALWPRRAPVFGALCGMAGALIELFVFSMVVFGPGAAALGETLLLSALVGGVAWSVFAALVRRFEPEAAMPREAA